MLAKTYSATLMGLESIKIEVEVDGLQGVPNLIMIGLPGKAVEEARERISAALINCGVKIRAKRTIVNLAPADLRKTGSAFELAIAVALLQMYGEIEENWEKSLFLGELALDGCLKAIKGALPLVMAAKEMGMEQVFIPAANRGEVVFVEGIRVYLVRSLKEFLDWSRGFGELELMKTELVKINDIVKVEIDMSDIRGQLMAKRCLEIAAAGGHNLLMLGPPGSGKSMLAKALVSILPPLTSSEAIELTKIYSICGLNEAGLVTNRPFRSPHHSISSVGLIGGGANLRPGEISLANRGILFLDELLEFPRHVLEAMRQPLEEGVISVVRAAGRVNFPARFTLIAAANPCPCGYYGSTQKPCQCSPLIRENYQRKLSGPILDRIDQILRVSEVPAEQLIDFAESKKTFSVGEKVKDFSLENDLSIKGKDEKNLSKKKESNAQIKSEKSEVIRKRIVQARLRQAQRYVDTKYLTNSEIPSYDLIKYCPLSPTVNKILQTATKKFAFSARSYFKIIKIARTIADLAEADTISPDHMAEAISYRLMN